MADLEQLLRDVRSATKEELMAQGESLARNYTPGSRQAMAHFPGDQLASTMRILILGRFLADEYAESLVTSHLVAVGDGFYDSRHAPMFVCGVEVEESRLVRVAEAIDWLEARGRIERHAIEPAWVRVLEVCGSGMAEAIRRRGVGEVEGGGTAEPVPFRCGPEE